MGQGTASLQQLPSYYSGDFTKSRKSKSQMLRHTSPTLSQILIPSSGFATYAVVSYLFKNVRLLMRFFTMAS